MASAFLPTFGVLLKRYRRAAHLTQAQLAERAGFSANYISKLESGAREPQRATVILFANALELSTSEREALQTSFERSGAGQTADTAPLPIGGFLGAIPTGPFVGRKTERTAIAAALQRVVSRQGQLLVLSGEPGVGKTRLAQEITLLARTQGFLVLTGRCYEPHQNVAYYPFLEALTLAEASVDSEGKGRLSQRWPEVIHLLPDQAAKVQTPTPIDDRAARQRLFWQVTSFLRTLAEQTPLAVLLDDLHWADSASLDLLQHLARHTRERRILHVATYRDVEVTRPLAAALHDLGRDELLERIALQPLSGDETTALIGVTLSAHEGEGVAPISPQLSRLIHQRSEGNPFFTRQLIRALQEQDDLHFEGGQWRLSAEGESVFQAPESIRAVIGQRLARLTPHTHELLCEASVLGQAFTFPDLQQMSERGEQEVEDALVEASRAGIVREGDPDHYHFNHALTLDTFVAGLPTRRKRRLHRQAADAIERLPDHERRAAELAHHLLAADENARALPYVLLAGDQAEVVYAHAEAEAQYRVALALAEELGDMSRQAETLERLGSVVGALGRYDEAIELLKRALGSYQSLQDQAGELRALAALLEIQGEFGRGMLEEAVAGAQAILTRLEPSDASALNPALAAGLAGVYRGLAFVFIGATRSVEHLTTARRAVELARLAGDERQLVAAQHRLYVVGDGLDVDVATWEEQLALAKRAGQTKFVLLAHIRTGLRHGESGAFALGMPHLERSLAVAEEFGDPIFLAWQLGNFTEFLLLAGDWQRARETAARAEAIIRETDPRRLTWHAADIASWPGALALLEGGEEEGRRLLECAIDRIEQMGSGPVVENAFLPLAEADLVAGRAAVAWERLTSYLQRHYPTPSDGALGAHTLLAWAEGALGQYEQAEARLAAVLNRALVRVNSDALRTQGLLATMQGRWDVAADALDKALECTRAMPYLYGEAKALWVCGRLEAARANPVAARQRFKTALAICDQLGEGLYRKYIEHDLADLKAQRGSMGSK
jgi:transcriptional regulator with XRE-family HTH domain/tetratricopeptide (TPR) repeat protein